jgi:hypothetical protein
MVVSTNSKKVDHTCNRQLQDSIGILRTILLVVLKISAFGEMSLMVVCVENGEQIRDTRCGHTKEKGRAETLPYRRFNM